MSKASEWHGRRKVEIDRYGTNEVVVDGDDDDDEAISESVTLPTLLLREGKNNGAAALTGTYWMSEIWLAFRSARRERIW